MRLWSMSFVEAPGRPLRAKPAPTLRSWGHHSLVPLLVLWPVGSRPPFSPGSAMEWPGGSQKQRGKVFQEDQIEGQCYCRRGGRGRGVPALKRPSLRVKKPSAAGARETGVPRIQEAGSDSGAEAPQDRPSAFAPASRE